jgi:D-glycero-alpha-D-manno-heptose-7-phosphate kinase
VGIEASAPIRICDIGGWTDTWFGGPGRVLNVAVTPAIHVAVRAGGRRGQVLVDVDSFGERYAVVPGDRARRSRHPLVEAAIDSQVAPADQGLEVQIRSEVPPGCGTGTSASVAVALLGALAAARADAPSPRQVAEAAHRLEIDRLGAESGIQDQLAAALGGVNYMEIERYPEAAVTAMPVWEGLGQHLTLIYLGRAHDSSAIHRQVIERGDQGRDALGALRAAAVAAREAVLARDLEGFGRAMDAATDGQRALHPRLVGTDAERVIRLAAGEGALGAKPNGAGGEGGSVSVVTAAPERRAALEQLAAAQGYQVIPIRLSPAGLRVRGAL